MNDFTDVIELVLGHDIARLNTLCLRVDLLELLLLRGEVLAQLEPHILLGLEVLLHGELLASALLKLSLALQEFLLLLHRLLHLFVTAQKFLFHVLDLLEQLLLLALLLLLGLLLLFELTEELLALFFSDCRLSLKLLTLLLELLANGELVLLKSILHLCHLLFVDGHDDVRGHFASDHCATMSTALDIELTTTEGCELFSQTSDLIVELPDHSIFRILIDTGFVLDVLGTCGISQRCQRLIDVIVSWTKVGNHHCLSVAS